jgi:hypothetical protein
MLVWYEFHDDIRKAWMAGTSPAMTAVGCRLAWRCMAEISNRGRLAGDKSAQNARVLVGGSTRRCRPTAFRRSPQPGVPHRASGSIVNLLLDNNSVTAG